MTQREWEKTYGGFSMLAFFGALMSFVAMMALIPHESPEYMDTAHHHPGAQLPSPHLQWLSWLMVALIVLGFVLMSRWIKRRNLRIKAETYAEARERKFEQGRRRHQANFDAYKAEQRRLNDKEQAQYEREHAGDPF